MALRLVSLSDVHPAPLPSSRVIGLDVEAFEMDMKVVAGVCEAALFERTHLVTQLVNSLKKTGSLYWECVLRVTDEHDSVLSPGLVIPAPERLGSSRFYDVQIMRATLDLLRADSGVSLGCDISALSVVDDAGWSIVAAELAQDRELASRLVIDVAEAAIAVNAVSAVAFVATMHSFGCHVALDDFGKGGHPVDFGRNVRPDLIKIDVSFLPRDPEDLQGRQLLAGLVTLAGDLAEVVIVERVENADAYNAAAHSGACWVRGYPIEMPSAPSSPLFGNVAS